MGALKALQTVARRISLLGSFARLSILSREILLANVLGAFQAPISAFARAIQAIVDKDGEAAPAEAEAPAEA